MSLMLLVGGSAFSAAFVGAIAGVLMALSQGRTQPLDPERELRLLTLRLRHPIRASIARWIQLEKSL